MKFLAILVLIYAEFSFGFISYSRQSDSVIHFSGLEQEGELYVVREFELKRGELQELKSEKYFRSEEEAENNVKSKNILNGNILENFLSTNISSLGNIWEVRNQWDLSWEERYSEWVSTEVNAKFFKRHDIKVDCADVAYALKWIFSRIHKLPMVVTLYGTKQKFSNYSFKKEWASLRRAEKWSEDTLFLESLSYILKNTSTKTLETDLSLVKVSEKTLRPGTVHYLGGHTQIFKELNKSVGSIPIYTFESGMPADARELSKNAFFKPEQIGWIRWAKLEKSGIKQLKKKEMPFYISDISDDKGQTNFISLLNQIGIKATANEIMNAVGSSITMMLQERIKVVEDALNHCRTRDCSEGTQNYEDHSTPSRDKRYFKHYLSGMTLYNGLSESRGLGKEYIDFFPKELIVAGKTIRVDDYFSNYFDELISSNPWDETGKRWGADFDSILEFSKIKLKSLLDDRSKRISLGKCEKCSPDDDEWQKMSTHHADFKIKEIYGGLLKLCEKKYGSCENDLGDLGVNQISTIKNIIFSSGNPVDSNLQRLGDNKDFITIDAKYSYFYDLGEDYLLGLDEEGVNKLLINTKTKKEVDFPTDIRNFTEGLDEGVFLNKDSHLLVTKSKNDDLNVFDALSGNWLPIKLGIKNNSSEELKLSVDNVYVIGDRVFLGIDGKVHHLRVRDDSIEEVESPFESGLHKIDRTRFNNKEYLVSLLTKNKQTFYFMSHSSELKVVSFDFEGFFSISATVGDELLLYSWGREESSTKNKKISFAYVNTVQGTLVKKGSFLTSTDVCFIGTRTYYNCGEGKDSLYKLNPDTGEATMVSSGSSDIKIFIGY